MNPPRPRRLPGDPDLRQETARILRVDHAGEYGAVQIYAGQLAVLRRGRSAGLVRHMAEQEKRHLATFDRLVPQRRIRPTLLHPIWHVASFALGAATALMGERAAMACTVAVEEVIDEHYREQAERIADSDPELARTIEEFRAEEIEHRETARSQDAERAPGYSAISGAVKTASRLAIWLSTRI